MAQQHCQCLQVMDQAWHVTSTTPWHGRTAALAFFAVLQLVAMAFYTALHSKHVS